MSMGALVGEGVGVRRTCTARDLGVGEGVGDGVAERRAIGVGVGAAVAVGDGIGWVGLGFDRWRRGLSRWAAGPACPHAASTRAHRPARAGRGTRLEIVMGGWRGRLAGPKCHRDYRPDASRARQLRDGAGPCAAHRGRPPPAPGAPELRRPPPAGGPGGLVPSGWRRLGARSGSRRGGRGSAAAPSARRRSGPSQVPRWVRARSPAGGPPPVDGWPHPARRGHAGASRSARRGPPRAVGGRRGPRRPASVGGPGRGSGPGEECGSMGGAPDGMGRSGIGLSQSGMPRTRWLRRVPKAEVDLWLRDRVTLTERENRELRQANEILSAATRASPGSSTPNRRGRSARHRARGPAGVASVLEGLQGTSSPPSARRPPGRRHPRWRQSGG